MATLGMILLNLAIFLTLFLWLGPHLHAWITRPRREHPDEYARRLAAARSMYADDALAALAYGRITRDEYRARVFAPDLTDEQIDERLADRQRRATH
jgi:hypothetical protein